MYVVGVIGGWALLAGYLILPHSPQWSPAEVAQFYQQDTTSIRIGMVVLMLTALVAIYYSGRSEPPSTSFRWWRLCAWSGPVFLAGLTVFFAAVAGYLPPPREDWTAARVAEFYVDNETRIKLGMEGCILFACLYFTWSLAVQRVMERSAGPDSPLPRIQTFGGAFTAWLITMFSVLFLVTAFRADERSPDDLRLLNDVAFFVFDMTVMVTFFQVPPSGSPSCGLKGLHPEVDRLPLLLGGR